MFTVKLNADEKHTYLQREKKKLFKEYLSANLL